MEDEELNQGSFYQNNKVLIWILIFIVALVVVIKLVRNNSVTPKGNNVVITINPKEDVKVSVGNSIYLYAMVENVLDADITWMSSDSSIAKVNGGTVVGVKPGEVNITATYTKDGKDYKTFKKVTVIEDNANVQLIGITFPSGDLCMPVNSEYQLGLILNPTDAYISSKNYNSANSNVASVSSDGLVKSLSEGHTTITVQVNEKFIKTIDVYVSNSYKKSEIVLSPNSISFGTNTFSIKVGSSQKLNYTIAPTNIDYSKLVWESSNPNIVTVDNDGNIKGISVGNAIVSLSSLNGKKASINIEVVSNIVEVSDISISTDTFNMKAGDNIVITPVVSPIDATNKTLGFVSSDSEVAFVSIDTNSQSATISALKAGTAVITVSSGRIEKKINVTVTGTLPQDSDLPTTIKVRSDKDNLANTYEGVKDKAVSGETKVTITLRDGVAKVKYCVNKYGSASCTPNIDMYITDTVLIPSGGIYVLRVKKYDYQDKEIKSSSVNYINGVLNYYINTSSKEEKINNNSNNTNDNSYQTNTIVDVKASKLAINSQKAVGKFLAVDVESTSKFSVVRFCYSIVNKNSTDICSLDITSTSVLAHDGTTHLHPKEALKTYFGSLTATYKKTLWFDIDGLDSVYNKGDTNSDILLSFAIGTYKNGKVVFSNPIKVRMNMTKKVGIDSYWSSKFIK